MNKLGIAFSTKDRVVLSKRTVEPLLQSEKLDLHWIDGSATEEGRSLPYSYANVQVHSGIRGGADAAIAYGLSILLSEGYEYCGLAENDVLLSKEWLGPTMALFERGRAEGLEVGAVSARCYEDRILCQRDGMAVMHNLGAGFVIFTRQAAKLVMRHARTAWAPDNRTTFSTLAGIDLARYWAFRGAENWITWDWHFDAVLARHGLASLALVPSPVEMIGQDPPLAEQGLRLATEPVELLRDGGAFWLYADNLARLRAGEWRLPPLDPPVREGQHLWFPHQLRRLGAVWSGPWHLRWEQGFGPFAWRAQEGASLSFRALGSVAVMAAGPGHIRVRDTASGFDTTPTLGSESAQIMVPGTVAYRTVEVTALTAGVTVHGVITAMPQPEFEVPDFRWSDLPSVED